MFAWFLLVSVKHCILVWKAAVAAGSRQRRGEDSGGSGDCGWNPCAPRRHGSQLRHPQACAARRDLRNHPWACSLCPGPMLPLLLSAAAGRVRGGGEAGATFPTGKGSESRTHFRDWQNPLQGLTSRAVAPTPPRTGVPELQEKDGFNRAARGHVPGIRPTGSSHWGDCQC